MQALHTITATDGEIELGADVVGHARNLVRALKEHCTDAKNALVLLEVGANIRWGCSLLDSHPISIEFGTRWIFSSCQGGPWLRLGAGSCLDHLWLSGDPQSTPSAVCGPTNCCERPNPTSAPKLYSERSVPN
jgi:hypothetical protein